MDSDRFGIGSEWAYRLRDDAPSQPVRILAVHPKKTSVRVEIEFLDGIDVGQSQDVPGVRLRVPWAEVAEFDKLMAGWQRIHDLELDESEQAAVETVFRLLIPTEVAEWEWSPMRFAASVHDRERLTALIGVPIEDIVGKVESFELDGGLMLSPMGTLMIAEGACQVSPLPVLAHVIGEEKELREKVKRGGRHMNVIDREEFETSPEWEYHWYLTRDRPRHELLRQWCGHRAVTFQERLLAAEAENQRLDVLVAEVIDSLEHAGDEYGARAFEEEHERDRITPERARPIVDRPLAPSEIPIRYVTVPRRWGY